MIASIWRRLGWCRWQLAVLFGSLPGLADTALVILPAGGVDALSQVRTVVVRHWLQIVGGINIAAAIV